jgi:uncharacterized membrane protein YbhN (UPF0104 family)
MRILVSMRRWQVWVAVSIVLFGLLVWRTRPWEAFATGADLRPLVVVVALNLVVIAAWAFRSARLMAAVGHPLSMLALVPVVSFANTINNLTPVSSGEALRAVILRQRHGVAYGRSTAVILVERLWAIWIMAVSAGAAALGTIVPVGPPIAAAGWIAAAGAIFAPAVAYRLGLRPAALAARFVDPDRSAGAIGPRARLGALLRDVDGSLAEILASPSIAIGFVASTSVVFVVSALQLWLILLALGHDVPPVAAWAALGIGTIAGVISALPFGLGAADVVMTALLAGLGVPAAAAAAAALLLRATVTLPLGLAGTASWIALNRGPAATAEPTDG